jgi:hypothetical protein
LCHAQKCKYTPTHRLTASDSAGVVQELTTVARARLLETKLFEIDREILEFAKNH